MKSVQIAEFFARIGIKADVRQLEIMTDQMRQLAIYTKQLRSSLKNSFKVNTDYSNLGKMRQSLGATRDEVRRLKDEILRLRGTSITTNINSRVNRTMNTHSGGGGGQANSNTAGSGHGPFRFGMGAGATAGAMFRAGVPAGGAAFLGYDTAQAAMNMEGVRSALLSVMGTKQEAAAHFKWLQDTANRVGFSFLGASRQYINFMAAGRDVGMQSEELQRIFNATVEYGRVLNLSADDLAGSLKAMQQMLSKTTVSAEELKGQLGERFPGAVGIAARSMNKTVPELLKMMEKGELLAKDLLPAMATELEISARKGGALAVASRNTAAEIARLGNMWRDFQDRLGQSGFLDAVAQGVSAIGDALSAILPYTEDIGQGFKTLGEFIDALISPATALTAVLFGLAGALSLLFNVGRIQAAFFLIEKIFWVMNAMGSAKGGVVGILITGFIAWLAIIEDVVVALSGGNSILDKWARSGNLIAQILLGWGHLIRKFLTYIDVLEEKINPSSRRVQNVVSQRTPRNFVEMDAARAGYRWNTNTLTGALGQSIGAPGSIRSQGLMMDMAMRGNTTNNVTLNVTATGDKAMVEDAVSRALESVLLKANNGLLGN